MAIRRLGSIVCLISLILSGCQGKDKALKEISSPQQVNQDSDAYNALELFHGESYQDYILYYGEVYDIFSYGCETGLVGIDTRTGHHHVFNHDESKEELTTPHGLYYMTTKGIYALTKDENRLIKAHTYEGFCINNGYILTGNNNQSYFDVSTKTDYTLDSEDKVYSAYMVDGDLCYATDKAVYCMHLDNKLKEQVIAGNYQVIGVENRHIYLVQDDQLIVMDMDNKSKNQYALEDGPMTQYYVRDGCLYGMQVADENQYGRLFKFNPVTGEVHRTILPELQAVAFQYDFIYAKDKTWLTFEYDILNHIKPHKMKMPTVKDILYDGKQFVQDNHTLISKQIRSDNEDPLVNPIDAQNLNTSDILEQPNHDLYFINHKNHLMSIEEQETLLAEIGDDVYDYDYNSTTIIYTDQETRTLYRLDREQGEKQVIAQGPVYHIKLRDGKIFYQLASDRYTLYCYDNGCIKQVANHVNVEYEVLKDTLYIIDNRSIEPSLYAKSLSGNEHDVTIIDESTVTAIRRLGDAIYFLSAKYGVNGSDYENGYTSSASPVSSLYRVSEGKKEFVHGVPLHTEHYFTFKDRHYFHDTKAMTILELGDIPR
ncbi:hypothetical protein HZI73_06925 [Vallitalea pronyensis]|uniref:DUF5050 domain-containing protein n=1 Tax=Vallitalea pronyensis TaxID=1348613 RepID=A0A8J8MI27_9FIRM|nr:hypothetical protein [Vallitalea pronyensis]QUI22050.1 hypothetical protein HZI73_06925 [Vallitalea pronyensis]